METTETIQPIEALRNQVERLKVDVIQIPDAPNFHAKTGVDLRNDEPARLQHYTELLTKRAERDMQEVLDVRDKAKFSKYTGMPLPEKVFNEEGGVTQANLEARLKVFRGDCGYLVEEAKKTGIIVPKFDSQEGFPIPQDSLRALLEVRKSQQKSQQSSEIAEIHQDLDLGLKALAEMKRIKREDQAARVAQGLSSRI